MNLKFDSQVRDILKILWKRGEFAPKEQFLLFSTIFCCLLVDLCVKTGTRFSLRDKRLVEISEFEITRVDCMLKYVSTRLIRIYLAIIMLIKNFYYIQSNEI